MYFYPNYLYFLYFYIRKPQTLYFPSFKQDLFRLWKITLKNSDFLGFNYKTPNYEILFKNFKF